MADEQSIPAERVCTKCSALKLLKEFNKSSRGKYGRSARCRDCDKIYAQQNSARINEMSLARYHRNQEPIRLEKRKALRLRLDSDEKTCGMCRAIKSKKEFAKCKSTIDGYRSRCKSCSNEVNKRYREENPDKSRASTKAWAERNSERKKASVKEWVERNPERMAATHRAWKDRNRESIRESTRRRFELNPILKIHKSIRERLRQGVVFGRGGMRTFDLLGYSRDDLKLHLERQFVKGMAWDNYGEWHVDHITPLSSFQQNTIEEIRACWALTNLRPIWAKDNLRKHANIHYLI
ncbi:hypothetical protein [Pseudomonas nicosulfuronedens]